MFVSIDSLMVVEERSELCIELCCTMITSHGILEANYIILA